MKNLILSIAVVTLVAPAAFAAERSQSAHAKPSAASAQSTPTKSTTKAPAAKTHVVNAEFVSYDATSKTVTLKDDKGQTSSSDIKETTKEMPNGTQEVNRVETTKQTNPKKPAPVAATPAP